MSERDWSSGRVWGWDGKGFIGRGDPAAPQIGPFPSTSDAQIALEALAA